MNLRKEGGVSDRVTPTPTTSTTLIVSVVSGEVDGSGPNYPPPPIAINKEPIGCVGGLLPVNKNSYNMPAT